MTARSRRAAPSSGVRSTSGSRTSTSRTTTGRRTARPRRTSAASSSAICGRTATSSWISTKAGYDMWPGPYGEWGSRKYLLASLDQSLARMGLDYVDIFYSHRFDPQTPLEETMGALDTAVRQGKALYAGISSYSAETTRDGGGDPGRARHAAPDPPALVLAAQPLDRAGAPRDARGARRRLHLLLAAGAGDAHATSTWTASRRGRGPAGRPRSLPSSSRTRRSPGFARSTRSRPRRGQTLAQLALAWTLRDPRITSTLIGASSVTQLEENVGRARKSRALGRRARRDRPPRDGERDQHLGAVERELRTGA